ncbi:MAG: hypothetical protein ACFBSE_14315 [Prochloraceae cyanobacterium]
MAWEQYTLAPCTTIDPDVSLREHAQALYYSDRWILWERP